jgi:alpha-D-xyloside xylohydrolase
MKRFGKKDNRLLWRQESHLLELQGWGKNAIRIRATLNRDFTDVPQALITDGGTDASIRIDTDGAVVRNGGLEARITDYGRIVFSRTQSGETLLEEADWTPEHAVLYPASRTFEAGEGELFRIEARFKSQKGERFYGLGQHRHGLLNQKGAVVELMQRNAEVCIPFLLSSRGYGFLWNNPAVGRVELGTNGTRWIAEGSHQLDYLVITGDSFAEIMSWYADCTGHAPLLPEWAAGFWQCKLRYRTQEELLAVAREYHKRGIPLAVIVVDFFHWTRQGEWKWDPEYWPDPQGMIRELTQMGVKLMVSIWPSVNPKAETAAQMKERGLLLGTRHGPDVVFPFIDSREEPPVYIHYYDATNPLAREFIWQRVKENYYDPGVRVFWLDACEPEISPIDFGNLRYYLGNGLEVANIYPLMHQKGFYDGMKAAGESEIITLCRSGWAGSQRFAAAIWSGDIPSSWDSFNAQIRAGLNIMMSGIAWWTTDIGGFYGGNIEDPDFRELLVRWFQYGTFCPLFRLHGVREPREKHTVASGAANEIWSFGERNYEILRSFILLRERMKPYILEQVRLVSEKGLPIMRPLFFDYPVDEECWNVEDEFLFGADLIVAPVATFGARSRKVYLPHGAAWIDAWSGKRLESGTWLEVEAPLERIPLFIRQGASLRSVFQT